VGVPCRFPRFRPGFLELRWGPSPLRKGAACRLSSRRAAVRSAVKRLRTTLRQAGIPKLADAINGSVPGRYSFKLSR